MADPVVTVVCCHVYRVHCTIQISYGIDQLSGHGVGSDSGQRNEYWIDWIGSTLPECTSTEVHCIRVLFMGNPRTDA